MTRRSFFAALTGFAASIGLPFRVRGKEPLVIPIRAKWITEPDSLRDIPRPTVRYVRNHDFKGPPVMSCDFLHYIGTLWGQHWVCTEVRSMTDGLRGIVEGALVLTYSPHDGHVTFVYSDEPERKWSYDLHRDKRVGDWDELLTSQGWRRVKELHPQSAMYRHHAEQLLNDLSQGKGITCVQTYDGPSFTKQFGF